MAGPLDPLSPAACRTELGTYEYLAAVHGQVACRRCPVAKLDQFRLAGAGVSSAPSGETSYPVLIRWFTAGRGNSFCCGANFHGCGWASWGRELLRNTGPNDLLDQNTSLKLRNPRLYKRLGLDAVGQLERSHASSAFSAMNGHSRATPSQAAQAKLLDAAADKGAGRSLTMFR